MGKIMSAQGKSALSRQVVLHKALRDVCQKLTDERLHYRVEDKSARVPNAFGNSPRFVTTDRDIIINAVINKALSTKEAIVALCCAGFGDDAACLTRVMLENAIIVVWMLHADWRLKADTYALSTFAWKANLAQTVLKHFPDYPDLVRAAERALESEEVALSTEVFGDQWKKWAKLRSNAKPLTIEGMVREIGNLGPADHQPFMLAMMYPDLSGYVHSAPQSTYHIAEDLAHGPSFALRGRPFFDRSVQMLELSNVLTLWILQAFNVWAGGCVGTDLQRLDARIKRSVKRNHGIGVARVSEGEQK